MCRPIALVLLLVLTLTVSVLAGQSPWAIHLSWQQDPSTTMTIMWRSEKGDAEVAEYGSTDQYGNQVSSTSHTYTFAGQDVFWQTAEITGLTPGETYHYRCGEAGNWSADHKFTTAPSDNAKEIRFAVFGDSRGGYDMLGEIFQLVAEEDVDFILFTGDFTNGGSQYEYNLWFEAGKGVLEEIPFISVHGNHEGMGKTYFDQFAYPNNEMWFSFDYGAVHFISLLTITEEYVVEQRPWIIQDLRGNDKPWIVGMGHKPVYVSDLHHGPTQYLIDHWVDLFDRYRMGIYFNGHTHCYERTWPMRNETLHREGIVYVTTGAAGAPLYPAGQSWWTAYSESVLHYTVVSIRGSQLKLVAKKLDGSVLDKLVMKR